MAITKAPPRKGRPKAVINPDSCTGCEVCVAVCPVDCIDKVPGPEYTGLNATCIIDQPVCIGCVLCEKICPWDAITMVPPQEAPVVATPPPAGPATSPTAPRSPA